MSLRDKLVDNPFFVLGVEPDADRATIEREGNKLLGMLQLGFAAATSYHTPFGDNARTADAVRIAMATLRDPSKRLLAELWVRHAIVELTAAPSNDEPASNVVADARARLGWGRAP